MSFIDIFRPLKKSTVQRWKELGTYQSVFNVFGNDIYKSSLVRSCIRPLAEFSSKAEAKCSDKTLERLLNNRPNMYMSGRDFIYKTRTMLELNNNVFIYIERDDTGKPKSFYPVPSIYFEAVEYANGLFIKFTFGGEAARTLTLPWADLAVLRKDYCRSDIAGEDNTAVLETLELLNTSNQGVANAIKSTANLRGILKSTQSMLAPEAVRKMKDDFVADYMNLNNNGGIAAIDKTTDFIPINMSPVTASYAHIKEFREDIYRYFGVNDKIVMSDMTPDEIEAFYELKIEPFLVKLSTELTSKIYSNKALAYNNSIVYEADKLQFASLDKKISIFKEVVLYGGMTINEWRAGCNMAPLDGGDVPIRRLDADFVDKNNDSDGKTEEGEKTTDES